MNHCLCLGGRRRIVSWIASTSTSQSSLVLLHERPSHWINARTVLHRSVVHHSQLPVIKIPKYLEPQLKNYEKKVHRDEQQLVERRQRNGDRRIPIITSKTKPQYNHYLNQVYDHLVDRQRITFVSDGWKSGVHKGDVITFHAYVKTPQYRQKYGQSLEERTKTMVAFEELGLSSRMLDAINREWPSIKIASEIQRLAIPEIQSGQNVICCAETGSGKTLAYAAPIVESVLRVKEFANKSTANPSADKSSPPSIDRRNRSPRALVVVPSRELVIQTANVFRKLADQVGLGVATLVGGEPTHSRHSGFDIVVTTIGLVNAHVQEGVYSLRNCRHLVVDEADTLLDDSFDFNVLDLLAHFRFKSEHTTQACQLVMVSATLPQDWKEKVEEHVDSRTVRVIKTDQLHQVMKHVRHKFYRLHKAERTERLIYFCKRNQLMRRPTMVFANTSQSSSWVWHFLNENGVPCAHLCKNMSNEDRIKNMTKFQSGELNFLACTDLASRGIDTVRVCVHSLSL